MKPILVVNWCGHSQEFVPWPEKALLDHGTKGGK
jgi:hypothetical protein